MKLLADENIPLASVGQLRDLGHDVISISERSPGMSDEEVLRLAQTEQRVVITFDGDFGELVFRRRQPASAGILYLRFVPQTPSDLTAYISRLIGEGIDLRDRFTTADRRGIRQTVLARNLRGDSE